MNTFEPKAGERVLNVHVTEDAISVDLYDGRTITATPKNPQKTPAVEAVQRIDKKGVFG